MATLFRNGVNNVDGYRHVKEKVMLTNLVMNLSKKDEEVTIESTREWYEENPDATLIEIAEEVQRQIQEREKKSGRRK